MEARKEKINKKLGRFYFNTTILFDQEINPSSSGHGFCADNSVFPIWVPHLNWNWLGHWSLVVYFYVCLILVLVIWDKKSILKFSGSWFGGCEDYHIMLVINFDWCTQVDYWPPVFVRWERKILVIMVHENNRVVWVFGPLIWQKIITTMPLHQMRDT